MTTAWSVPREWVGETAAILASGPSLTREQCEAVRGRCRVIAVNNQAIETDCDGVMVPAMAPWADVLYAADAKWWRHYEKRALKFAGTKVTIRDTLPWPEVMSLKQSSEHASFDPRPTHLVSGGNSGYQAIHLAVHFGVSRVILLGFDMKYGRNGRKHWFGAHPGRLDSRSSFGPWMRAFDKLAGVLEHRGVKVVNCTPDTALRSFRRVPLEVTLNEH